MKRIKLSDQVRRAIDGAGVTRYRICEDTGIDHATLSRFMNHKAGLSTPLLDTLADYLDLNIVKGTRPTKKGRRK